MKKSANMTVYVTDEYDRFKFPKWNRQINPMSVERLGDSMKKFGYLGSPIAVNEFNEVIDGQHRLKACEMTKTPVLFVVYKGYGFEQAMELNNKQKTWSLLDYIKAYSEMGNVNYTKLLVLIEKYHEPLNTIWDSMGKNNMVASKRCKEGKLVITDEDIENALSNITFIRKVKQYRYKFNGRFDYAVKAICRLRRNDMFDDNTLLNKLSTSNASVNCQDIDTVVESLEEIYNKNSRNKVFFYSQWRMMREEEKNGSL